MNAASRSLSRAEPPVAARGRVARRALLDPSDRTVVLLLSSFFLFCGAMYFSGLGAGLAVKNFNNPVFYADRYAIPELYPDDAWAAYQRGVYPFMTLVHAVPALLLKYAAIPSIYPTFVIIALNDMLVALAMYWLSRALRLDPLVSLATALFAVASQALSWNLAGYIYIGHDNGYAGDFVLPFAIAVVPALIQRRTRIALVLAAIAILVYPPFGVMDVAFIGAWLVAVNDRHSWREALTWAAFPLVALALVLGVQLYAAGGIAEPLSHADDVAVVMVNGHFVPLWVHGKILASPYIGFCVGCVLAAVAGRNWRHVDASARLVLLCVAVVVAASFVAWAAAYRWQWLFVLRTSLLRNSTFLTILSIPIVVAYLTDRIADDSAGIRLVAGLVFAVLVVDRGTAWVAPVVLLGMAYLAISSWHRMRSNVGLALAALVILVAIDLLFGIGISEYIFRTIPGSGRISEIVHEAARRLSAGRLELGLFGVVMTFTWWAWRRRGNVVEKRSWIAVALCLCMALCLAGRTAAMAASWSTGVAADLQKAELWAKSSTPVAAKFVFFEFDERGNQLSWQTLAQRGTATLLYTHQKAYATDRVLWRIDQQVNANYGFTDGSLAANPYPYDPWQLNDRYLHFGLDDFLRVGRLSGSNYVVLRHPRTLQLPIAYENDSFTVYRLPAQTGTLRLALAQMDPTQVTISWTGAAPPDSEAFLALRDPGSGTTREMVCCVALNSGGGTHMFPVPSSVRGQFLPAIGVRSAATGRLLPLDGIPRGSQFASWEYLKID